VGQQAVDHGQGSAGEIPDAAAHAIAACAPRAPRTSDGCVVGDRGVADGTRLKVGDAATGTAAPAVAAEGLVVGEKAAGDRGRRPKATDGAPVPAAAAIAAEGLVAREKAAGDDDLGIIIGDGAALTWAAAVAAHDLVVREGIVGQGS